MDFACLEIPSLMTLPRELRDQICTRVILAQKNEPPSLESSFEEILQGRQAFETPHLHAWVERDTVQYRRDSIVANSSNLLLVNRQLYSETLENLKLISEARNYDLDIMVCEEVILAPTWLRVPLLTTNVDKVYTTLRIAGSYRNSVPRKRQEWLEHGPYSRFSRYRGFRGGCGAGPAMDWQIYMILERFFKVGLKGGGSNRDEHHHVTIKLLDINVQTPPGIDPSNFRPPQSSPVYISEEPYLVNAVLDPGFLARFITNSIERLLDMNKYTAEYGTILFEYIDKIVVRLDGEEMSRYDLAQFLRDLEYNDSFSRDEHRFNKWKKEARKMREKGGLKVLEE